MSTPDLEYVTRLKRAALALKELEARNLTLQARLEQAEAARHEPIAVVGVGCRIPGGGSSPAGFWRLLHDGVDAVRDVPAERWRRPVAEASPDHRGELRAALLDDVDLFDADFFGISPREAVSLDPQQRLLLEVAWEALEDAAIVPARLEGRAAGVFVGVCSADYGRRVTSGDLQQLDLYALTGNAMPFTAGRLSYSLGLQGPALAVDTACSSSLVALHLACQSLRSGECELALAGGVNLILSPVTMRLVAHTQALSPEGRCRTFDAGANGFVRGEGCGVVVLKRLSDAAAQGDVIRAVIRGSAVNQDGRSAGITAPNVLAQQALLRQALARAGVAPAQVGYVEAHGTGTPLGDPIEFEALRAVLGTPRADGATCALASLKTNVGHLEAAAGIAAVIKTVLAFDHDEIPRHLHFERLNPRLSLDGTPFVIPTHALEWKRGAALRIASVSSFGVSGTNAHVVLQEGPPPPPPQAVVEREQLLVVSSKTEEGLKSQAQRYAAHLREHVEQALEDVCHTAGAARTHFAERVAVLGRSGEDLADGLLAWARGEERAGVVAGRCAETSSGKVAFVFSGQGSQWLGMGRELWEREAAFRSALAECDEAVRAESGFSVVAELRASAEQSRLAEVDVVQPLLWAMAVGLAAQWRAYGLEPAAVMGHSLGEVAAATVAGILSVRDGARVICRRSRLAKRLSGRGAMAVVELGEAEAQRVATAHAGGVEVAVVNSRRSTVLSGRKDALEAVVLDLEREGVFCRWVKVDYASHSAEMDELREELEQALAGIEARAGGVPLYSTVTGAVEDGSGCGASYWVRNLRERVRFADALERLLGDGHVHFVEVSPHPVLVPAIGEALGEGCVAVGSLRREQGERQALLESLGRLYVNGHDVDWARLYAGSRRVVLPTYAWQRERYWIESAENTGDGDGAWGAAGCHALLGAGLESSVHAGTRFWQRELGGEGCAYLREHRVGGAAVMPGAGYLEMGWSAGRRVLGSEVGLELSAVSLEQALVLSEGAHPRVQTVSSPEAHGEHAWRVSSLWGEGGETGWTTHASGRVRAWSPGDAETHEALEAVRGRCLDELNADAFYAALRGRGLEYGAAFRGVEAVWRGAGEALGRVKLPEAAGDATGYEAHPALLDACMQVLFGALPEEAPGGGGAAWVPVGVERARLGRSGEGQAWCHARWQGEGEAGHGELVLYGASGEVWGELSGVKLRRLAGRAMEREEEDAWLLSEEWEPVERAGRAGPRETAGRWLVVSAGGELADALGAELQVRGGEVVRVGCGTVEELVDALRAGAWRGVIHLGCEPGGAELELDARVRRECASALHLVQALGRMEWRDAPRLWLVTRGVQAVGGEREVALEQAALWGLGRVIALEHPEWRCTRVDVGRRAAVEEAAALADELGGDPPEEELALRSRTRLVARLVRRTPRASRPVSLRADGACLVTGGLGGLGLAVAAWLVEHGARRIVLVGRSGAASEAQREALAALETAGAEVVVACADVSDRARMAEVMADVAARGWPLRGLVHAAGVIDDGLLAGQDDARCVRVLAPKVSGAWILHQLTRDTPLDFCVFFSSAAALVGSPGQGTYAAANAFLDALAHHRQALGLRTLSINWGAFSDVGLAAGGGHLARLEGQGVRSLTPQQGLRALARLLGGDAVQIGVMPFDVRQWIDVHPQASSSSRLARLVAAQKRTRPEARELRQALVAAPPDQRAGLVEALLREQLARVLKLKPERIDRRAPFRSLGLDSLMGLEVRNRLEAALGLRLPATLIWSHPTLATLAQRLVHEMCADAGAPAAAPPPREEAHEPRPAGTLEREVQDLSDEEARAALEHELRSLSVATEGGRP